MPAKSAINRLSEAAIRAAKAQDKAYNLPDGGGLGLEVQPTGSKWWRLRFRFAGKEKMLSLGVYPEVSLRDARDRRDAARRDVAAGVDPAAKRKAEKATRSAMTANTFEAIAREWSEAVHQAKVSQGHAALTLKRLEQTVFPYLGAVPIASVTAPLLLEVLRRIERRGTVETAHRVRQACGQVFRYAVATGRAERDPAADLRDALQPVVVQHHAAILDPQLIGGMLRAFDGYMGLPTTRAALQLSPLLFQRPGELRQAEWEEIDLEAGTWTIPAAKMKRTKQEKLSGTPHTVPLSAQAAEILKDLKPLTGRGRYVFPNPRTSSRPMSQNAVLAALRRMGYDKTEMTGHGFRAIARTLLVERLDVPEAVVEAQLAHAVRDALGRAYNRAEFLAQRRQMMQRWADYLDELKLAVDRPNE